VFFGLTHRIILGWKKISGTNPLAYFVYLSWKGKNKKVFERLTRDRLKNSIFSKMTSNLNYHYHEPTRTADILENVAIRSNY